MVILQSIEKLNNNDGTMIIYDHDEDSLIPGWYCSKCGSKNHCKLTECQICQHSMDISEKQLIQFPVIEMDGTVAMKWKCDYCYNVNSQQTAICLKCGETNEQNTEIHRKWTKRAVNV